MKKNFLTRFYAMVLTAALALMYAPEISEAASVFAEEEAGENTVTENIADGVEDTGNVAAENASGEENAVDNFDTPAALSVESNDLGVNCGDFTVMGGTADTDYKYENNVLTILTSAQITISGTTSSDKIVVANGVSANITLNNVSITADIAFKIEDNSTGNVTVTLVCDNTLTSTAGAGLQKNGNVSSGILTITGTGSLTASGTSSSAGIGGSSRQDGCNIVIDSGTITAESTYTGAGIGGGEGGVGYVTINGGTVNATGSHGAAIGSGDMSFNGVGKVVITGGTVIATSNSAGAAIGGGGSTIGYVTISGGNVTAINTGDDYYNGGSGIGGGDQTAGYVTIDGGTVTAQAYAGAGIGGGINGSGEVTINKGDVTAYSQYGAGIGGGQDEYKRGNNTGSVTINGGTVTASSTNGSSIGGGAGAEGSNNIIDVKGGRVSVQSGDWDIVITAAGVEIAGYSGSDTDVTVPDTIEGYPVTAIGADAFSGSSITSVTIPDSVTSIGDGAFSGCTGLGINYGDFIFTVTSDDTITVTGYTGTGGDVTIPSSVGGLPVTAIGEDAFSGNTTITSVTIPNSVTSVGDGAFSGCDSLTKVTCPESLEEAVKKSGISEDVEVTTPGTSDTPAKSDNPTDDPSDDPSQDEPTAPIVEHVHSFGAEWKFDGTNHWHECECGEKSDIATHVSNGGVVTTPAASTTVGVMTYTCTICGYSWTSEIAPTGTYYPSGSTGTTSGSSTSNVITVTGLSGARAYGYNGSADVRISEMESAEDAGKKAMEQLGVNYFYYAFDISVYDKNGNPLTLKNVESITLEIPVPDNMQASQNIVLYHIPDGVPEKISSTMFNKNGKKYVRFTANKFSPYMMVAMDIEDVSSGSGADGNAEPIEPVSRGASMPDAMLPENKKSRKRRRYRIVNITKEGV